MLTDHITRDIRDVNLSFLMLAQSLIRVDKAQALYRLGISEAIADLIDSLSSQQLVRVATRNQMLCGVRFDDEVVWSLLVNRQDTAGPDVEGTASPLHASVLMAGRAPQLSA